VLGLFIVFQKDLTKDSIYIAEESDNFKSCSVLS